MKTTSLKVSLMVHVWALGNLKKKLKTSKNDIKKSEIPSGKALDSSGNPSGSPWT